MVNRNAKSDVRLTELSRRKAMMDEAARLARGDRNKDPNDWVGHTAMAFACASVFALAIAVFVGTCGRI